jgi:hypothetical protein
MTFGMVKVTIADRLLVGAALVLAIPGCAAGILQRLLQVLKPVIDMIPLQSYQP